MSFLFVCEARDTVGSRSRYAERPLLASSIESVRSPWFDVDEYAFFSLSMEMFNETVEVRRNNTSRQSTKLSRFAIIALMFASAMIVDLLWAVHLERRVHVYGELLITKARIGLFTDCCRSRTLAISDCLRIAADHEALYQGLCQMVMKNGQRVTVKENSLRGV